MNLRESKNEKGGCPRTETRENVLKGKVSENRGQSSRVGNRREEQNNKDRGKPRHKKSSNEHTKKFPIMVGGVGTTAKGNISE